MVERAVWWAGFWTRLGWLLRMLEVFECARRVVERLARCRRRCVSWDWSSRNSASMEVVVVAIVMLLRYSGGDGE
jgi:hypothetical protein